LDIDFFYNHPESPGEVTLIAARGSHVPNRLSEQSGVWILRAGKALLKPGKRHMKPLQEWAYLILETGEAQVNWGGEDISLSDSEGILLPLNREDVIVNCITDCHLMWLVFAGPLAPSFLKSMGALLNVPMRQSVLPSQIYLSRQIVQVIVRHDGTADASFQLQQLMWGLLASHSGQPVAMDAMLSHEIAKVVDALRADQYQSNFSLQDMANISRMPMETFRKRFVAEVGLPPLNYLLYCKMEQAKKLLQAQCSVKEAGACVGMTDPYHFSKQFKKIVGISPSAYKKQAERVW
jgi:AraC-type DNA-binding domain-containing proteins